MDSRLLKRYLCKMTKKSVWSWTWASGALFIMDSSSWVLQWWVPTVIPYPAQSLIQGGFLEVAFHSGYYFQFYSKTATGRGKHSSMLTMRSGEEKILRYLSMEGSQVAGWLWRNKPGIWRRWNNRLYCERDESMLKASRGGSRTLGPPRVKQLDSIWKQQWSRDVLFLLQWSGTTSYPAIAHKQAPWHKLTRCYCRLTAEPSL